MFCPKCGKVIDDNTAFCQYCGQKFGISAAPAQEEDPVIFMLKQKEVKSAKNKGIIGIIFAFLIPLVTFIVSGIGLSKASKIDTPEGKSAKNLNIVALILGVIMTIIYAILRVRNKI
jgi:uncharacterized membrane protein YvbJ